MVRFNRRKEEKTSNYVSSSTNGSCNDAGRLLEYIHLDYLQDEHGALHFRPMVEVKHQAEGAYTEYSFSAVKVWDYYDKSFILKVYINSEELINKLKSIIGDVSDVSWNQRPLIVLPQFLLTYFPTFKQHLAQFTSSEPYELGDNHLEVLIRYLETSHKPTLLQLQSLQDHEEVTFEYLWYLLIPGTLFYFTCPTSGEARVGKLVSGNQECGAFNQKYWKLDLEYTNTSGNTRAAVDEDDEPCIGISDMTIMINYFRGVKKITNLKCFPLKFHPKAEAIEESLIERGKKWLKVASGVHHVHYNGVAFIRDGCNNGRVKIDGRIMIDKISYKDSDPNAYRLDEVKFFPDGEGEPEVNGVPDSVKSKDDTSAPNGVGQMETLKLTDDQLLMATPILFGFSLSDKLWSMFSITNISEIVWQTDAFDNLVLPSDQKDLIKSLVESHRNGHATESKVSKKTGSNVGATGKPRFDDFIIGKGRGLIINLFGPPGVGKTLSAEATSEYVRRPLYAVGIDEISGHNVEKSLQKIFDVASTWGAIVLIDEADVFLERRSVSDLSRNALVAVFLRKLEYYKGVLFLTTNRVKVFDEAFQSRIHVSLRYTDLSSSAKQQIWSSFLQKAGMDVDALTETEWTMLSEAKVNGRQIKNAVRSCQGLAESREEDIGFGHIVEVLKIMEQFEKDFRREQLVTDE